MNSAPAALDAPAASTTAGNRPAERGRALLAAVVVAVATIVVAAFGVHARSTYGARTSSDEPQYLLTALSIVEDLDLDISDEIDRRAFEPFHEIDLDTQTFELNASNQRLSPHDPLLPLLAAPAMGVGGWVGVRVLLVALGGLAAGVTTWTAIRRFGVSPTSAIVGVGAFTISAPFAAYSTQVFPEIPAALAVVVAVAAGTAPRLERRHVLMVVMAVVALPWLSVKYAPVAAVIAVGVGWRLYVLRRRRALAWSAAGLAAAAIAYLAIHQRVYGGWTVYSTGDHFIDDGEFAVVGTNPDYWGRSRRLVGLLADRRFGLIPWAPIWVLAPAGVVWFGVRARAHRVIVVGAIAAGWLIATFVALTMHGWWSPGRQIVVIAPLVAIALATMLDEIRWLRWPAGLLGVVGASTWIWLAVEASTDRRALIVDFYETAAPGYRAVSWAFAQGWPRLDQADAVLAAWTVVVIASMLIAAWRAVTTSRTAA